MSTPPSKEAMLDALHYELSMFYGTAGVLRRLQKTQPVDRFAVYVHLESFLVHVRNLFEFFQVEPPKSGPRADDVTVLKIIPGWTPPSASKVPTALEGMFKKISRRLSHFTEDHITEKGTDWGAVLPDLLTYIDALRLEFDAKVSPRALSANWAQVPLGLPADGLPLDQPIIAQLSTGAMLSGKDREGW